MARSSQVGIFVKIAVSIALGAAASARAATYEPPASLARSALSESVPFAFAPAPFSVDDYRVEWVGPPIPGVDASLGARSFEWVRVGELFVVPRGRVLVSAEPGARGTLRHAGFTQVFAATGKDQSTAEMPVALVSLRENPIEIELESAGGARKKGQLRLVFAPRSEPESATRGQVMVDPSCSPHRVEAEGGEIPPDTWMFVTCRVAYVLGAERAEPSLEVFVVWEQVGGAIQINGVETPATSPSLWALRLRSQPGRVELRSGKHAVAIRYSIPDRRRNAFLGLGIGPYRYTIQSPEHSARDYTALATLYFSYFLTESNRIVLFDAAPIHRFFFNDAGLYFVSESFRILDRRVSGYVLLGGHVLGFMYEGRFMLPVSLPQGVELLFRDFAGRGYDLRMGGFFYPPIIQTSYYNLWLRWGGAIFAELNYIQWQEPVTKGAVRTESVGVTVGFPLARFL